MTTLDVKKLTSCGSDWEANQYTLLSRVKVWTDQIRKNKLFPALHESIQLSISLEEILRENLESKWWFDSEIRARRLNERITVYEKAHQVGFQLDKLLEFVEWALYLNRPVLEEGEYYWHDLIGLEVINQDGINLGNISKICETGANDVLVINGTGENKKRLLIPLVMDVYVKKVDLTTKTVHVDWQLED